MKYFKRVCLLVLVLLFLGLYRTCQSSSSKNSNNNSLNKSIDLSSKDNDIEDVIISDETLSLYSLISSSELFPIFSKISLINGKNDTYGFILKTDNISTFADFDLFKKEMSLVRDYFERWSLTAIENNVKEFNRDIPVEITTIGKISGSNRRDYTRDGFVIPYSDNQSVKSAFSVKDYKSFYILNINCLTLDESRGTYREFYVWYSWTLDDDSFSKFLEIIENDVLKRFEEERKSQNLKDLFK